MRTPAEDNEVTLLPKTDRQLSERDYNAKRYGTNWVREAYAREKFDHEEMDRLMGIAVEAGDKTEPYPWGPVPQEKWEVHGTPTYRFFTWFMFPDSRGSRKHWRWQWGTPSIPVLIAVTAVWVMAGLGGLAIAWPHDPVLTTRTSGERAPLWAWLVFLTPFLSWGFAGLVSGFRWLWCNPPLRRE